MLFFWALLSYLKAPRVLVNITTRDSLKVATKGAGMGFSSCYKIILFVEFGLVHLFILFIVFKKCKIYHAENRN